MHQDAPEIQVDDLAPIGLEVETRIAAHCARMQQHDERNEGAGADGSHRTRCMVQGGCPLMQLPPTWTGCRGGKFHCIALDCRINWVRKISRPGTHWTVTDAKINRTDITKRQLEGAGAEDTAIGVGNYGYWRATV